MSDVCVCVVGVPLIPAVRRQGLWIPGVGWPDRQSELVRSEFN